MYNSQLDTFICIADNGSFNKAAEKLFISSTAVIKQINALEAHLDIKLLNRTNHGITLTPAGSVFYRHARNIIEYSANAIAETRKTMKKIDTTFCVGTSMLNPCKPFMDVWYRVSDCFPEYKLHIVPFEDTPRFYDIEVFNRCEQSGAVLLTLDCWADVHPSLVTIPVKWNYTLPYGILYPLSCGKDIQNVIEAISTLL